MSPTMKFESPKAREIYDSLLDPEPGNPKKFVKDPVLSIPSSGVKSFKDIKMVRDPEDKSDLLLDHEVIVESIRGVLPRMAEDMGLAVEQAIFSADFMRHLTEQPGYNRARFQIAYAIALLNLEPESFAQHPQRSELISRGAAEYFKKLLASSDPEPEVGETLDSYDFRLREAHTIRSKCADALSALTTRDLYLRKAFEDYDAPGAAQDDTEQDTQLQAMPDLSKSQDIMARLEGILQEGLTVKQFLEWQNSLEQAGIAGQRTIGTARDYDRGITGQRAERQVEIHDTRVKFISKLGQCLLDRELPWSGRIKDVRVMSTGFAQRKGSDESIKYIALTCQFEYDPGTGKTIEITVLERPSRVRQTDLETGRTNIVEENATYLYVSRSPRIWMDVFGEATQSGALQYNDLGRTTAVDSPPQEIHVREAKRVRHSNFSSYGSPEEQDAIIQEHLDKVVKTIISMQDEVLQNKRA